MLITRPNRLNSKTWKGKKGCIKKCTFRRFQSIKRNAKIIKARKRKSPRLKS